MSSDLARLPDDLRNALREALAPAETLLYAGQPDWRAELGTLVTLFVAGLCWSAVAFPFTAMSFAGLAGWTTVSSYGAEIGTAKLLLIFILSIPFSIIGTLGIAAPLLSVRKSLHTVHAVTNQHVLSVSIGRDKGVESYPLDVLNFITRHNLKDGTGTLEIGHGVELDADGSPRPLTIDWPGIPDAWRAEASIREHAPWVR